MNILLNNSGGWKCLVFCLYTFLCALETRSQESRQLQIPDTLLLGNYNSEGYQALLQGVDLIRLPVTEHRKMSSIPPRVFVEGLESGKLVFHAFGDNRDIWEFHLTGNELRFYSVVKDTTAIAMVSFDTDRLPGQTIMFTSPMRKIYGLIRVVSYTTDDKNEQPACLYSINEEELLFEVFLNMEGKVLKGCGYFLPPEE